MFFVRINGSREDVTIMDRFWKGAFAWLCVLALTLSWLPALAEFSPRYQQLSAGEGMTLTLRAQFDALSPLSKSTLGTVNEGLDGFALTLTTGNDRRADFAMNGDSVLQADVQRKDDYRLTTFSPNGGSYLTAQGDPDALTLLWGRETEVFDPSSFPAAYLKLAPQLYEKLSSHVTPKKSKEATSIKNASKSTSSEIYTFTGDDMNEFWPRVLDTLLPAMEEALAKQPALYMKAEELLEELEFSGECRFKRFLNKEGEDMGVQFTGNAALGEDKRKVTLFYGFTPDKGGYLSFSAPATKGKNNFKVTAAVQLTSKKSVNTVAVEGTYTRTYDGKTVSGTLTANLKNTVRDEDEKWTGKATVTRTENKVKSTWTLTPDLTFDDDGLKGTVAVQKKEGNKNTVKAALDVSLGERETLTAPAAASAKDLREASPERAKIAVQAELDALTDAFIEILEPLTEKELTSIEKDLQTDAWFMFPITSAVQSAVAELTAPEEETFDEAEEEEEAFEQEDPAGDEQSDEGWYTSFDDGDA